jgi:hypothetical protein
MVCQIKVRDKRDKRDKSDPLLMSRLAHCSIGDGPVTHATVSLPTRRDWRAPRLSSGVRVIWPRDGPRRRPVEWCFPSCQNCSIKDALGAPCLRNCFGSDFCPPQALRRAREDCGQGDLSIHRFDVRFVVLQPSHHTDTCWCFASGGRCTGTIASARPSRAVVIRRLRRVDTYCHISTDSGPRPGVILVTMAALYYLIVGESSAQFYSPVHDERMDVPQGKQRGISAMQTNGYIICTRH